MPPEPVQKLLMVLLLGLLTISAFFIRLENFKNSQARSIDEIVYYRMGKQVLQEGLAGYNTIPYGRELAAQGRPLPDYFFQPVFKYPPLFTLLIVQSMKIFGSTLLSAGYVSLITGALLIPLTYLLGAIAFGRNAGLGAAIFAYLDPVSIICSQKIWLESPLAFFSLCSIIFFTQAFKTQKSFYSIWGGLFCGLATLVKYPGILIIPVTIFFVYRHQRPLFQNKNFLLGCSIPFLMLMPWGIWNFLIYKADFLRVQWGFHSMRSHQGMLLSRVGAISLVILIFIALRAYRQRLRLPLNEGIFGQKFLSLATTAFWLIVLLSIADEIVHAFQFAYIPTHGWQAMMFEGKPLTFYFGRLVEFSPFFLLGYASFIFWGDELTQAGKFIRFQALGILIFYIIWGNFQSRYILASIPLFLVLASYFALLVIRKTAQTQNVSLKRLLMAACLLFACYTLLKAQNINSLLSFPNDLCYF